ncbi:MAG TPA: penicillin-binding protein 2 [Roseiflexaceae bacterium]|nr:penicillin-binding protein 2 [Roseiflexaceae bacterium]
MATHTAYSRRAASRREPARPVTISRWRINLVLLVAVLIISRVAVRLGELQVAESPRLSAMARSEIDRTRPIEPRRGVIRDRMGNVLALDVDRESLYAEPQRIDRKDAAKLATLLSGLLSMPVTDIQARLLSDKLWVPIKRWIEPEIAERIAALMEEDPELWAGLHFQYEPKRVYPQGTFAAHTVGAVNQEGVGISGVEGFYDQILRGHTGVITAEVDAQQNPIWIAPQQERPASDGADLELTLDPLVQHVIEAELKRAVDEHHADGGTVIVLEPKTGAIRGMASYPAFDPNRYYEYPPETYNINPAIAALYEPGSTFKILTVAAGLQARAFTADTQVNDVGVIYREGWAIGNWNRAGNGMIDPGKVLYYSSNVGALLLNELTGPDAFYAAVQEFGFGRPTGVDIAGEAEGLLPLPESPGWSPVTMDNNAFGQSIAVTPLQQVRMVAAIGNDGVVMRPYIVQKRCRGQDCVITQPKQVGQPIEPGVAWTVRRMLVNAANHYAPVVWGPITGDYGDTWLVPGYEVCAKTGTSSIPDGQGGWADGTIGSVVGLAPAENARYAILVKIDRPRDDIWGVVTAIPVYQAIVEQLMRYERIQPNPAFVGPGQTPGGSARP